jgi:hypothetical protein
MHVALTGLLLLGSCPALAFDNDRFTLSAGYELGYDTNVFRLPSQAEAPQPTPGNSKRGDQLSAASIGIRYHGQIGRQAFEAGLVEAVYRYKTFRSLDNNAMASEVRWVGEIGNSWRPLLEWTRRKNLAGFADVRIPVRNIQTTDRLNMELRYVVTPSWEALSNLSGERLTNDAPEEAALDSRTRTIELGIAHTPPTGNRVELHLRYIDARYPNSSVFPFGLVDPRPVGLVDNSYVQNEAFFTGLYTPTGWGQIDWRIGYGARRYSGSADRNLDSWIGRLAYTWNPSDKTSLLAEYSRSIGDQWTGAMVGPAAVTGSTGAPRPDGVSRVTSSAGPILPAGPSSVTGAATSADSLGSLSNFAVNTVVGISPRWQPTSKTALRGHLQWWRRDFHGPFGIELPSGTASVVTPAARDATRTFGLSVAYNPWRTISVTLSWLSEHRRSTDSALDFDANVFAVGLRAQF